MRIYHGSINIIQKPEYGKGKLHNDYGLGFYCTENIEMAKEWACADELYMLDIMRQEVKNNDSRLQ